MNYPEEPITLMVQLQMPADVPDFIEEIQRIQSRIKVEMGARVSNFRVKNIPESRTSVLTFDLAPLFNL